MCGLSTLQNLNFHNRKRIQIQTSVWLFFPAVCGCPVTVWRIVFDNTARDRQHTTSLVFISFYFVLVACVVCLFLFVSSSFPLFVSSSVFVFSSFPFFLSRSRPKWVTAKKQVAARKGKTYDQSRSRPEWVAPLFFQTGVTTALFHAETSVFQSTETSHASFSNLVSPHPSSAVTARPR